MKPRDDTVEVPLSALIDIVFLLIIFFVVTASMQKEVVDYQIRLAKSYFVKPPDKLDPRTFIVNIRHEKLLDKNKRELPQFATLQPVFSIRGVNYTPDAIKIRMMRARERFGEDMPVVIRASAGVKYAHIDRVNGIVLDAGLYRVHHATESRWK